MNDNEHQGTGRSQNSPKMEKNKKNSVEHVMAIGLVWVYSDNYQIVGPRFRV